MGESDTPSRGPRVLIVEDDDVTATDLRDGLIGAGYVVARTSSADEALFTLTSTSADLILMSLMLEGIDGLVLCSILRARSPAPIIVLTARNGDVDRALALQLGAIDSVTRPVDLIDLLARVGAVVQPPHAGNSRSASSTTASTL